MEIVLYLRFLFVKLCIPFAIEDLLEELLELNPHYGINASTPSTTNYYLAQLLHDMVTCNCNTTKVVDKNKNKDKGSNKDYSHTVQTPLPFTHTYDGFHHGP